MQRRAPPGASSSQPSALRRPVLTKYFYWLGVERADDTSDFTFADASYVHPNTSASPYAHWDWMYYSTRNFSSQCGMARYNSSFDYFLGGWLAADWGRADWYCTAHQAHAECRARVRCRRHLHAH